MIDLSTKIQSLISRFTPEEREILLRSFVQPKRRKRLAKRIMFAGIIVNILYVRFEYGPSREWHLSSKEDKDAIYRITHQAMEFAGENGGTDGQVNHVRKVLTDAGYHITK